MRSWWQTTIADNPVLRYEAMPKVLRRLSARAQIGVLAGATVLGLSAAIYAAATISDAAEIIGNIILWIWALLTVLVSGLQLSGSVVGERDKKTWDALIMTRLRPGDIVVGKLLGTLLPLWTLGAMLLPGLLVLICFPDQWGHTRGAWWYVLIVFGSTLVVSASFSSLAIYCSMCCHSVLVAQLMLFGIGVGIHTVASMVTGLLAWIAARAAEPVESALMVWLVGGTYCLLMLAPGYVAGVLAILRFRQLDRYGRV